MQPASAAVLTLLSVFFGLGCLSAHRSKPDQNDRNAQSDEAGEKKKNQPHIVFILIDDQGFNDIGYHNPTLKTPTLDKLAAEGVKLENYYVQPICTPSRSQLLTGRYQIHTGLQHSIIRPSQPSCLPSHMDTLPERLREAGYATHMIGKWHLGFYSSPSVLSYGSCDGPGLCGYDLHENEGVAWGQEGKYSTTLFTQRARKILESHDPTERPLFLLLSLQAVHTPLQTPKSYIYPYRDMVNVARRKFAAMVSTVDEAVRNVTYALRKYGYYRNSVIVYSTDNGAQPFTGGSNWPLRGRKGTYWEGGVRGVAFVHSPLLRRRRRVSTALLHITDWFPTLVGLAGGNISRSHGLDGFDVWPAISEGKDSPRQEILHNIDPLHKPAQTMSWEANRQRAAGNKPEGPAFKKPKKKKAPRLQPQQKSEFKLKTSKKSKPKLKSKPPPKLKVNPLQKSKLKPKLKTRNFPQSQKLTHYKPFLMSSGAPSASGTKSLKPQVQQRAKSKSRRTTSQKQNLSRSRPPQPKSKRQLKLLLKSKSRQTFSKYQNTSQSGTLLPRTHHTPQFRLQLFQPVWDTSVQAAIRVGDWKLLTGDPGHGDWVPQQVLSTFPGSWWNLERSVASFHKPSTHRNVWLFNITADPCERRDLSDQRPDVVQQLLARLAYYNQTAVPVYFPPDDPRANPSQHDGAWVPWVDEEEDEEGKYQGVYKKGRNSRKKKKKKKCRVCKLQTFFLKLNTRMMSNRI
ncbi:arylsulfatase I-like isoform 2-T2 [Acanthopagrus schlegelii]